MHHTNRRSHRPARLRWMLVALSLLAAACHSSGGPPLPGYVPDPAVYARPYDAAQFIEAEMSGGATERVYRDIVLLVLNDGEPRTEAQRIASLAGGTIVGQIPDRGLYQLEVPVTTQAELDAKIALVAADAKVRAAGYDADLEDLADDSCPVRCDNESLTRADRCPFEDGEWYQALTIFEEIRAGVTLQEVRVGVVDSGLNWLNPELNSIVVIDAHGVDGNYTAHMDDPSGHGTAVTGMITAANDGTGVNGLALPFLRDRLRVVFGKRTTAFATMVAMQLVVNAGARVVNLSFGHDRDIGADQRLNAERFAFLAVMSASPNVLWVAAAPNHPFTLTTTNHAPGGIDLPNVITVGGTASCHTDQAWSDSARGSAIQIAAQAEDVPMIPLNGATPLVIASGNSIVAPMVTSLAAVLLSIEPTLTPQRLRDGYIRGYADQGPTEVGGALLNFPRPIAQLLLERTPAPSAAVREVLDDNGDGAFDDTWAAVSGICGGLSYTVSGLGTFHYSDISEIAIGGLAADQFFVNAPADDAALAIACPNTVFALSSFEISQVSDVSTSNLVVLQFVNDPGGPEAGAGRGTEGALTLERCSIDQRAFGDVPLLVTVRGSFQGRLLYQPGNRPDPEVKTIRGWFNLPFGALGVGAPTSPLVQYLEANCDGGRNR